MNKAEKIKAEIDRLKNELIQEVEKGYKSEFDEGRISAFEDMITFIDSFEEEPVSNDLEEAACEYDNCHIDDNNLAFKEGAQWMKQQMMNDAVGAEIYREIEDDDTREYHLHAISHKLDESKYKFMEKVKLIIIKEE